MYNSSFLNNIAGMWTALTGRTTTLEATAASLATKTTALTTTTDTLTATTGSLVANNTQLNSKTANLLANMVYSFSGTTLADGTFTVDYSALALTKPPKVIAFAQLAALTDVPVSLSMIGAPTSTGAKISVKRMTSIASVGLIPAYAGVVGIPLDVYVRPVP